MLIRANQLKEMAQGVHAGPDPRHRVLKAMGDTGASLHELDYEDVALSSSAMRLVRQAATSVLRRFCAVEEREVTLARALALFLDHVFWDEQTGGLILCADFPEQSFCLPIPRDGWGLRQRLGRVQ